MKSQNLTFPLSGGPGTGCPAITYGQVGQTEMKWTESCKWSSCQNAGDQGGRGSESGGEKITGSEKMFIFTLQSSLLKVPSLGVCVHVCKINRPCDEQPVPRWKHILWNATVLWRNLAKHWLGSIGLRLCCPANNTSLTLPRCHIWM